MILNFATTGGHFDSHDGIFYFLVAENVVINQSIKIDPNSPSVKTLNFDQNIENFIKFWIPEIYPNYLNGEKTPFFMPGSILGPLLAVPAYLVASITNTDVTNVVPFFTNSIIISLTSLFIFLISKNLFKSYKISFILALVYNCTTFVWPYNTSFFLQPPLALTFVISIYFLIKNSQGSQFLNFALAGFFLGLSILIHPSAGFLIPGFLVYGIIKSKSWKNYGIFIIVFIIISTIQLVVNYLKYDSLLDFGYSGIPVVSDHSHWEGMVGLLFSPGWGLIFYFPLVILIPLSFSKIFHKDKEWLFLVLYSFVSVWIFFGTEATPHWSGFGAWGPRYFIPILPLLVISLGYLFYQNKRNTKIFFFVLASIGFFINLIGKLVWYMTGYSYGWGMENLLKKENPFEYFAWIPYFSPIMEHLKVLVSNYGFDIVNPITKTSGCSIDVFVYCMGGIGIGLMMFALIIGLGVIIWKKIEHVEC
jgi:hypothetical protein